jgi:hypothetical protein
VISKELIENSSEWEKQDWVITAFKDIDDEFWRLYDGIYKRDCRVSDVGCGLHALLYDEDTLYNVKKGTATIYSVRRSDGVEFKVGDKVDTKIKKSVEIKSFSISNDESMMANFGNEIGAASIELLSHAPTPIFKTEDGKEVFEGDEYFVVNKVFEMFIQNTKQYHIHERGRFKYFSTRETALEYIRWHKPQYSLDDLRRWDESYWLSPKHAAEMCENFYLFMNPEQV